ncbi:MAG: hypothetical protein AAF468_12495 [Pseudomonadota bacterium]
MPNHITNVVDIEDLGTSDLATVRAQFVNDEGLVDFNVIKPMPECLREFEPGSNVVEPCKRALGLYDEPVKDADGLSGLLANMSASTAIRGLFRPVQAEDIPHIIRGIQNFAECGEIYWYDWCNKSWGTKWGAYDQPEDGHPDHETSFRFDTAWSHPSELLEIMSERCPGVQFHIRYADEDTGSNCGSYRLKDGVRSDEDIAPLVNQQTPQQRIKYSEFAFRLRHGEDEDPALHGYGPDWEYSDEIYDAAIQEQGGGA